LLAGTYTYSVTVSPGTNPAGCSVTDVVNLLVVPNNFTLVNNDTVICIGQSVQVVVIGSSAFTWVWTPATGVSVYNIADPVITPTATTTYVVTASYGAYCTMSHSFTITVDTPAIPVTIRDTICLGMTDNINLTFAGSSLFNFVWTPTAYLSSSTLPIVTINPALTGDLTYNITVFPANDSLSCGVTDVVKLHVAPNDFTLLNNDTVICLGQSVQVVVIASTEFLYFWTPVAGVSVTNIPNPVLTPTVSTSYTVTATYAPHCPDMMHHFYIEVDTLAHPIEITDTICLAIADSVNLSFPNSNTYTFTWVPTPPALNIYVSDSTSSNVYLLPPVMGSYKWSIIVSPRAQDCSVTDIVNLLVVPNSFTISPTVDTVCLGTPVQVIGVPYPLFTYQWIPTAGVPVSSIINPVITADTSALYIVSAYFDKCPPMRDTLQLTVEPNPNVFMGGNRSLCEYDTIHITAHVTPQWYGDYIYLWTPAGSLNVDNEQTVVYTDTLSQEVVVTVSTLHGCTGSDSAAITVYPGNFLNLLPGSDLCPGDSALVTEAGAVSYLWQPALYLSDSTGSATEIHPLKSCVYTVVGTSSNGCKDTTTFSVIVHPAALIYLPDSVTLYPGESYEMSPQTNCISFNWTPTIGLSNSAISNPVAMPGMSIKYYVTGTTEWGCAATDSITVLFDPNTLLKLPNAFTPGNGVNTEFKIIVQGIATINYFRIFNRWGEVVFETNDINKGWDGTFHGQPQPYGVYVYMIEATATGTGTNTTFTKQGNVTLIR
jgi:gliding motility-associated-like protein